MRIWRFCPLILALGCGAGTRTPRVAPETTTGGAQTTTQESNARAFIDRLARHQWLEATKQFDTKMTEVMPPSKLEEAWSLVETEVGPWVGIESSKVETKNNVLAAMVTCRFTRLRRLVRVVFDPEQRISGLWFRPVPEDLEASAKTLIEALARGDTAAASKDFDSMMRTALPGDKLATTWKAVVEQMGDFVGIDGMTVKSEAGFWVVLATCKFSRAKVVVKVAFTQKNEVTGLFFLPESSAVADWSPPSYAKLDTFVEVNVLVGKAPALPGTLSVPRGSGPFPAVVLVHGSGPSDADETVGAIKVFKDIAFGLASRGVAVLRYVKRSRHDPRGIVTMKEEVIDGASAAIELLRATPGIDPAGVFLVGHSQGGYLAPRIARENHAVAGIVILAGPTRPLQDSLMEQLSYLSSLEPSNAELKSAVVRAEKFKRVVDDPALRPDQSVVLPLGGPMAGAYFLDMRDYDPEKVAASLSCPLLILQGERDYQVTKTDFDKWQTALGKEPRVTFRLYPLLNHLFVAGTGVPSPIEYERSGHVDEQVVKDIAAWVARSR